MGAAGDSLGNGGLMRGIPIIGGMAHSPSDQAQLRQMANTQSAYKAYRPEAEQARMNALRNESQAYQGASNALAAMYGSSGSPTMRFSDPMGPGMTKVGDAAMYNPNSINSLQSSAGNPSGQPTSPAGSGAIRRQGG